MEEQNEYRIHDTETLIERAEWHAAHDHVKQGTYGQAQVNGHPQFKGCLVACLVAPVGEKQLLDYLVEHGVKKGVGFNQSVRDGYDIKVELTEEFGLAPRLLALMESVFENLPFHGQAINWIPDVARALPEGVVITDEEVGREESRIWHEVFDRDGDVSTPAKAVLVLEWLNSLKVDPPAPWYRRLFGKAVKV